MAVSLTPRGETLEIGGPQPVFSIRPDRLSVGRSRYDVTSDNRFLFQEAATAVSITVILNWSDQFARNGAAR